MSAHFQSILLEFSKSSQTISRTKQLHALITKTYLSLEPYYATRIVRFYANNRDIISARNLFDKIHQRSVFLWNSIIRAYAQDYSFDLAFSLFEKMLRSDIKPDNFTFACVTRACSDNFDLDKLRRVHGLAITSGFGLDFVCGSAFVTAYSKLGLVDEASSCFDAITEPDLVLWNSMIYCYGSSGNWSKGLILFNALRWLGLQPDGYTFVGLFTGVTDHSLLKVGQFVHGICVKLGFDITPHVGSTLVSMYSRCKSMESAHGVFSCLFEPDLVTWSSLITGYSQCGDNGKALHFFRQLNMTCKKIDPVLVASMVTACAQIVNVESGAEIHGYVLRKGFESNLKVASALLDMYSKCGFMNLSLRVFKYMPQRNIISYNSVITGLAVHGLASQAIEIFNKMLELGFKPDESTFSGLLCACCHAGLVNEGRNFFRSMKEKFNVQVGIEHCVYLVKLLGAAGELEEAYKFILSLPEPVDSGIWGALLSCCGESTLAEVVAQRIFENEPEKGSYRVMLSNVYACDGKWDEAKKLRDAVFHKGVRKVPGLSWI